MRCSPSQWRRTSIQVLFVCIAVFSFATLAMSQAQSNAADLQGVVRDPKGGPVASDHNNDRWPILNPDGPFCLVEAGTYTAEVRARQGKGKYALQIWRLP